MHDDDPGAGIWCQHLIPHQHVLVDLVDELVAISVEIRPVGRQQLTQRAGDRYGHRLSVFGIQPVVRVPESMNVGLAFDPKPRSLSLKQTHVLRQVQRRRLDLYPRQPGLVIQPDAHHQRCRAQSLELAGFQFQRMRILRGGGQTLDVDLVTCDADDEGLDVCGGRNDLEPGCRGCFRRRQAPSEDHGEGERKDRPHGLPAHLLAVKMDFGIMQ